MFLKFNKIIILIFVILISAGSYFLFFMPKESYVAKIDGKRITLSEYNLYLWEQKQQFESKGDEDIWVTDFNMETAENVAKQNALNSIVAVKAAVKQGKKMGMKLNSEQKNEAAHQANETLKEPHIINSGISLEKLISITEEGILFEMVFEEVTKNFTPNQDTPEKQEFFINEQLKWTEDISVVKNQKEWDKIKITTE